MKVIITYSIQLELTIVVIIVNFNRLSLVHNHQYVLLRSLCGQNAPHSVAFRTVKARTHDIFSTQGRQ